MFNLNHKTSSSQTTRKEPVVLGTVSAETKGANRGNPDGIGSQKLMNEFEFVAD